MGRQFRDGQTDGLQPVQSLNPDEIRSFAALLEAMGRTSFGGRRLGEAFDVLKQMCFDEDCFVVGTFSGAMTVGKMGTLICRMIDRGLIQAVVTTGALLAHGFSESIGCVHYKSNPAIGDAELYARGYNRVYDTIEMEANLNHVEEVFRRTLDRISCEPALSSECITRELGRTLAEMSEGEGMLKSAYLKGVPVYIPAFTDSEIGLDLSTWAMGRAVRGRSRPRGAPSRSSQLAERLGSIPNFNPFLDLNSYTARIMRQKKLGIFTIGGGVPRNWAQQVGPYIDITNHRLGTKFKPPRFRFGVRICPEPDYWGGLSGCTYSEGISWGKFVSPAEGGRFAEVLSDATLVWPLLLQGMLEELDRRESAGPREGSSASTIDRTPTNCRGRHRDRGRSRSRDRN